MAALINRVLLAFRNWEDRKKELEPLLKAGAGDINTLSRLQLDHLRQAQHRLRESTRQDEKPFLLLLNNQIARLEKQLFPNLLHRIFSQLKNRLIDGPAYLKQLQSERYNNMANLKTQLREAGLGSFAGRLENHLEPEQNYVRIPLDCQLGPEKRLSLDLHFEKDVHHNFQLNHINGKLLENGKITRSQDFELAEWSNLQTNQIWSLLEGRAMKQRYTDASGHESERWVALGNNGIERYNPDYDFDVRTMVSTMPALTGYKDDLIRYLENGQQVPTHWKQGRNYQSIYVQADPANRTLKLLDEQLRPITVEKLNQNTAQPGPKIKTLGIPIQKTRKAVKNGHRQ